MEEEGWDRERSAVGAVGVREPEQGDRRAAGNLAREEGTGGVLEQAPRRVGVGEAGEGRRHEEVGGQLRRSPPPSSLGQLTLWC